MKTQDMSNADLVTYVIILLCISLSFSSANYVMHEKFFVQFYVKESYYSQSLQAVTVLPIAFSTV